MALSLPEKITIEKSLIYIIIVAVLVTFTFIFYLFFSQFTKNIKVKTPMGGEEWEIGQTYQITWDARGMDKVGIVLFKGKEAKWIAKDVHASDEKYDWKIYPGQIYGDDYWIAVFEYPWRKGNKIHYSKGSFAITYPELASCDILAIENEWPYVPNDLPDLRKVFVTEESFKGNLGGLDGADRICQEDAEKQGFEGVWHAFLGGDSDDDLIVRRMEKTPRGKDGIYIQAMPSAVLIRGATCHQLLGKDYNEFVQKFSDLYIINEEKFKDDFFKDLSNVWLGRLDEKSKKNCTGIATALIEPYKASAEKYSGTTTCQNWTKEDKMVEGYDSLKGVSGGDYPTCYTPTGTSTKAVVLGGLSSGLEQEGINKTFTPYQGKYCDKLQKLICVEE
ncbi:MAG: Ser-Thr-rich GPI-anchored membrane family protein [Candidatus Nealsonbacteria bacterium]